MQRQKAAREDDRKVKEDNRGKRRGEKVKKEGQDEEGESIQGQGDSGGHERGGGRENEGKAPRGWARLAELNQPVSQETFTVFLFKLLGGQLGCCGILFQVSRVPDPRNPNVVER